MEYTYTIQIDRCIFHRHIQFGSQSEVAQQYALSLPRYLVLVDQTGTLQSLQFTLFSSVRCMTKSHFETMKSAVIIKNDPAIQNSQLNAEKKGMSLHLENECVFLSIHHCFAEIVANLHAFLYTMHLFTLKD